MAAVETLTCEDPGAGERLGDSARAALAGAVRAWRRTPPPAALVDVRGDAWHHAPELAGAGPLNHAHVRDHYQSLVSGLFGLPCPVVVSLDGHVTGLGLALATAADVRVATARTVLAVGRSSPTAGLLGGTGWLVKRAAGAGIHAQLVWAGRALSAAEGIRCGLVTECTADGPAAARAFAEEFAADATASSALKRATSARDRPQLDAALQYEAWLADVAAGPAR